jgi:hypothetical protein
MAIVGHEALAADFALATLGIIRHNSNGLLLGQCSGTLRVEKRLLLNLPRELGFGQLAKNACLFSQLRTAWVLRLLCSDPSFSGGRL